MVYNRPNITEGHTPKNAKIKHKLMMYIYYLLSLIVK